MLVKFKNVLLARLNEHLVDWERSFYNSPAADYADYKARVGAVNSMRECIKIVEETYRKFINEEEGVE